MDDRTYAAPVGGCRFSRHCRHDQRRVGDLNESMATRERCCARAGSGKNESWVNYGSKIQNHNYGQLWFEP